MISPRAAGLMLSTSLFIAWEAPPAQAVGPICVPVLQNCFCTFAFPCPVADSSNITKARETLDSITENLDVLDQIKVPQEGLLKAVGGQSPLSSLSSLKIDLSTATEGFSVPSLKEAGLDSSLISGIQNGSIPASRLGDISESIGLDRGAISIPGLDGSPISDIGNRLNDLSSTVSVPFENIPGHSSAPTENANLCTGPGDLISVGPEDLPNQFVGAMYEVTDMVPALDAFLSGGADQEIYEENRDEAEDIKRNTAAGALARSIAMRPLLPAALKSMEAMDPSGDPAGSAGTGLSTAEWLDSRGEGFLGSGEDIEDSKSLLREFEGYISKPAWDVNADRAGYGSDTVTRADGTVEKIKPGMTISREDAERDLDRRTRDFAATAARQVGPAWDTYDSRTKAALTSIAYNYGSLPKRIVPEARSGDRSRLANSIRTELSGDNDGINSRRRHREAALIDGRSDITPSASGNPGVSTPAASSFAQAAINTETWEEDLAVNDAIKSQLLVAQSETASMLTVLASLIAAEQIDAKSMRPVPLDAQNASYRAARRAEKDRIDQQSVAAEQTQELAVDHAEFVRTARSAVEKHNLMHEAIRLESAKPGVIEIMDLHEKSKKNVVMLEERLRDAINILYTDRSAPGAYEAIRSTLYTRAGNYFDGSKWGRSSIISNFISTEATRQVPYTEYGTRKPNPRYGINTDAPEPQFTVLGYVASVFEGMNEVYGGTDKYRIESPAVTYAGHPLGLSALAQSYLETVRRMNYFAELRRGGPKTAMSGTLWTEMTTHAPECITGPIAYTPEAAAIRPELFDLSKECSHLVWHGGDIEDYIPASLLGGADAALWMTKVSQDRMLLMSGGADSVRSLTSDAVSIANEKRIVSRSQMLGLPSTADHTNRILQTLSEMMSDSSFSKTFSVPFE